MASELEIQNSVYITLKTQYEEAKIEEVAKTPMIQIIDGPIKPIKMTSPKPTITILLSVFFKESGRVDRASLHTQAASLCSDPLGRNIPIELLNPSGTLPPHLRCLLVLEIASKPHKCCF